MITGRKKTPMVASAKNAAWLYRQADFNAMFEVIRRQDSNLHRYLSTVDIKMWTCSHFPGDRYDIMTSNFAECINGVLKEERAFPIAYFVDSIRKLLSRWFAERREKAVSLKTNFTDAVELALHMRHANMGTLAVQHIDANRSYVTDGVLNCMVDLEKRSCTCRQYDLDKIPCEHAIKVAQSRKIAEANLVDPVYTKGYLVAAYAEPINPTDEDLIPPPDVLSQVCLPPEIGKQRGRPKMKRYLSTIEKAKKFKRQLLKKRNQPLSTSNPPPARKEGNQTSRKTTTKKRCRSPAPSTPLKEKQTNPPRRTPSTNPSSRKKPKHSGKMTSPTTPSTTVRKGLFQSSPGPKKPTQGGKKTKGSNTKPNGVRIFQRKTDIIGMKDKRGYVCSKCNKDGHNRSTCKVATLLFG
ncbi:Uncharacterized protein Rs2_21400 [Raphanus sativus]|nr:Uncharacterized protein Rs2_21400 [Raphanus sativus]